MNKTHLFPKRQGHILVGRVGFSFEENHLFRCESFGELLMLGQNVSEILNCVKKILAPDFELRKENWNNLDGDVKSLSNPRDINLRRCWVKDIRELSVYFLQLFGKSKIISK